MTSEHALRRIEHDGRLLALVVPAKHEARGTAFLTESSAPLQMGLLVYPAGHTVPAHVHNRVPRGFEVTQEVLFVRRGRARLSIFDDAGNPVASAALGAGDVVLLAAGGHGLQIEDDTEILEVKTGPYLGRDVDKREM